MTLAVRIVCPGCGADLAPQLTLHTVYATLDEARVQIGAGRAPTLVCAKRGTAAPVDAPLLLRIEALALPLIFVAARRTNDTDDRAHLAALLRVAQDRCGDEWRDAWTSRMWIVSWDQLPELLLQPRLKQEAVPSGLTQALDALGDAADWSEVIDLVRDEPVLLTSAADALLAEYLALATLRRVNARDLAADRDLLRRLRECGVDAVADAHLARRPEGLAREFSQLAEIAAGLDAQVDPVALDRFIAMGTAVAAHPLLGGASAATRRGLHEQLVTACRAAAEDPGRPAAERRTTLGVGIAHQQQVVALAALCDLTDVVKGRNTLGAMYRELFQLAGDDSQLDLAISAWREVLTRDPVLTIEGTKMAASNLGAALRTRFRRAGNVQDLEQSIVMHECAVAASDGDDPLAHGRLNNLANALITRFQFAGDVTDIERAITLWNAAMRVLPEDQRGESATYLGHLASACHMRYHVTGALDDLERSVDFQRSATQGTDPSSDSYVYRLQSLGHVLMTRYGVSSDVQDLYAAIRLYEESIQRMPLDAPERAAVLSDAASGLVMRYQHEDRVGDLQHAITLYRDALAALPRGHVDRDNMLLQFGLALTLAYERRGDVAWLDEAIAVYREASALAPPPSLALTMRRLGDALRARSAATAVQQDIEDGRAALRRAIESGIGMAPHEGMRAAESLGDWLARDGAWAAAAAVFATGLTCADAMFEVQAERRTRAMLLRTVPSLAARAAFASARAGHAAEAALRLEGARTRLLLDDLEEERIGVQRLDTLGRGDLAARYRDAVAQVLRAERGTTALPEASSLHVVAAGMVREERRAAIEAARTTLRSVRAEMQAMPGFASMLAPLTEPELLRLASDGDAIVYVSATPYGGLAVLIVDGQPHALPLDLDDAVVSALMLRRTSWNDMTLEERLAYGGETVRSVAFASAASAIGSSAAVLSAFRRDDDAPAGHGAAGDSRPVIGGLLGAHLGAIALETALDETLGAIGQRVTGPLAEALRARRAAGAIIQRVVVIASGLLSYVPLHAAPFSHDATTRCLLDEVEVQYAPSARVFATARARRPHRASALTIVADPRPDTHDLALGRFEAELIQANFAAVSSTLLTGNTATRERVAAAALGATHVHLATHGVFHPETPLESSIELAGDEMLTLEDMTISRSFDGVRLVTFSACETALSDARLLPDEGLGLPSAAIRAGACCVIGALWSVREVPTALLMGRLYAALADPTVSPSRALGAAQCWLRDVSVADLLPMLHAHLPRCADDTGGELLTRLVAGMRTVPGDSRPFAHPQHWAAWIATGA